MRIRKTNYVRWALICLLFMRKWIRNGFLRAGIRFQVLKKHVRGSKSSYADFQEKQLNIRAAMLFTSAAVLKLVTHSGQTNHKTCSWTVTILISQLCKLHGGFIY